MWHHALSRIWRNLHRDIEIDGNWRSEELLKLGGGQKFLFFWRGGGGGGCPMRQRTDFLRELPLGGRVNFLGGVSYSSAYYGRAGPP